MPGEYMDEEVSMLRQQLAMLTSNFYQDRQAWLAEKQALEAQAGHRAESHAARDHKRHQRIWRGDSAGG